MAFAAGCYQQPDPPRQFVPGNELYDQFTSEGNRLVIDDPADQSASLKIRQRTRNTRVYDEQMAPVGRVTVDEDGVHQRTTDAQTKRTVRTSGTEAAELPEGWRASSEDRTWTIYDGDDRRLATWQLDDGQWTMDRPDEPTTWRVERDDQTARVVGDDASALIEVSAPEWSDPRVLALTLDRLSALDRYTLARWADQRLETR